MDFGEVVLADVSHQTWALLNPDLYKHLETYLQRLERLEHFV